MTPAPCRPHVIVGELRQVAATRRRSRRVHRLGQAEVEHLHEAIGGDLDVGGLQIAMDDAALVRRLERLGDLPRDRQRLGERHARRRATALGDAVSVALDQLHDQRVDAVVLLRARRSCAMLGWLSDASSPRLALEARQPSGSAAKRRGRT